MSEKSFFQYVRRYGRIQAHQIISLRATISIEEVFFWVIQALIKHNVLKRVFLSVSLYIGKYCRILWCIGMHQVLPTNYLHMKIDSGFISFDKS